MGRSFEVTFSSHQHVADHRAVQDEGVTLNVSLDSRFRPHDEDLPDNVSIPELTVESQLALELDGAGNLYVAEDAALTHIAFAYRVFVFRPALISRCVKKSCADFCSPGRLLRRLRILIPRGRYTRMDAAGRSLVARFPMEAVKCRPRRPPGHGGKSFHPPGRIARLARLGT